MSYEDELAEEYRHRPEMDPYYPPRPTVSPKMLPHPPFTVPSTITEYPSLDWETYSEAGYLWQPPEPPTIEWVEKPPKILHGPAYSGPDPSIPLISIAPQQPQLRVIEKLGKWGSLPGLSDTNRGLKTVGTWNYVTHPSFGVLTLRYDLRDGAGRRGWRNAAAHPSGFAENLPTDLPEYVRRGGILSAFNVFFEWCVWNLHMVPRYGWPALPMEQLRCAMAKSRASAYPGGLGDVGAVLQLPEHLRKDPKGDALVRKLTVPRNPTKGNPALRCTAITHGEEFEQFYAYNDRDVVAESAVAARVPDLTPREQRIWLLDFRINARGMFIDGQAREDCIAIVEQVYAKYNARLYTITNGAVKGSTEVAKMLAWMATQGVHLAELDEETVTEALKLDYPAVVLEVLRIRQALAFGSVRKLYAMRSQTCSDGRLRDQKVYYGAHTGLFNGRGVQTSNLYKGRFHTPAEVELALSIIASRNLETVEAAYGDALEVVADCLRSMIRAAPGHKLISADFTAIQAVALACLAGEQWIIDVFRTHGMIYEATASQMTGKPFQFYVDHRLATGGKLLMNPDGSFAGVMNGKHHPDRQDWGKLPQLSGGFAAWIAGWKRFGADKVLGCDANIKEAILRYRAKIPNTVEFWGGQTRDKFQGNERPELYGLEGAAISAVLSPGECFGYRGVRYQMHGDTLYCHPPSGGFIRYHAPRIERSNRDYASPWEMEFTYSGWNTNATKGRPGWQRMKGYGGVFTQNVDSHMCREIHADAMLAVEYAQPREYPIIDHVHDAITSEVPDDPAWSAQEFTDLITRSLPQWAVCEDGQPWPVKVPLAWEAYREGKWE